jgi:hypothetical protein
VVASKAELPGGEERRERLAAACRERDLPFLAISSVTGLGLATLVGEIAARLGAPEPWPAAL